MFWRDLRLTTANIVSGLAQQAVFRSVILTALKTSLKCLIGLLFISLLLRASESVKVVHLWHILSVLEKASRTTRRVVVTKIRTSK